MSAIDQIETNAIWLTKLDWDRPDQTITESEFIRIKTNPDILDKLINAKAPNSWTEFKSIFIERQGELGFKWSRSRGRGGPVVLEEVILPAEVGEELAAKAMQENSIKGSLDILIRQTFKQLHEYLGKAEARLDYSQARDGFKEYTYQNQSYKFARGPGSLQYTLSIQEYNYRGRDTRQHEATLGIAILSRLERLLNMDKIDHSQSSRMGRKLENADFEGFRIQRHVEGDRFLMYSFELKPTNSVRAISDAISQSINYKNRSHFTYIIIPLFDHSTFHDTERLESFIEMCRINGIGAISIDIDTQTHEIIDLTQILPAQENKLEESERLMQLAESSEWETCALCRRIVNKKTRNRCGWLLDIGSSQTGCMKELMEKQYIQHLE